jgi:glycerol-3-phosphate dehydrogenase
LTSNQQFIIPIYSFFDRIKYGFGLKIYDWMAGHLGLGKSKFISRKETLERLPQLKDIGLKGGVSYYDGQFDDARLALSIAMTCNEMGGCMLNYMKVIGLLKNDLGKISGVKVQDVISKQKYEIRSKMVVNATGVFSDKILKMDEPEAPKEILPSQGIHLVLDQSFIGGYDALMIPKTSDGRVLFAVPWYGKLVVGTTDTLREKAKLEPEALTEEVHFILKTARDYLTTAPERKDVLSVFAGLRPLAAPKEGSPKTKEISRSHRVSISESNLVSITGGKWTTFRKMGEDTVEYFYQVTGEKLSESKSANIRYNGFTETKMEGHWKSYGMNFFKIQKIIEADPRHADKLHDKYPYTKAEVIWSTREEMAIKIEDVLSRRVRVLFLDARAALEMAPLVAELMASELGKDEKWIKSELEEFEKLANKYVLK